MKYSKPKKKLNEEQINMWSAIVLVVVAVGAVAFLKYENVPLQLDIELAPTQHTTPAKPPVRRPVNPYPMIKADEVQAAITQGTAEIKDASPALFAYAHGTAVSGQRFVIGMADRAGNTFDSNKLIDFVDPQYLNRYYVTLLPHRGDVETLVYDAFSSLDFFLLTGAGDLELYSFDPYTLNLKSVASSTSINAGGKPAIVTDGTYVYGITNTAPSTVFKIKISDGTITSSSKGHISGGHSAAIGIYPGSTELYFGGGMNDVFEKVDADTLASKGIVDIAPCSATDDMPFSKIDDASGYVYVGCEIRPYGYRIRTSDLSAARFTLPGSSLGLFAIGPDLYNAAQDGNIDVFSHLDLGHLDRYHIASSSLIDAHSQEVEPNELFFSTSTGSLYFTAWYGIPGMYRIATSSK